MEEKEGQLDFNTLVTSLNELKDQTEAIGIKKKKLETSHSVKIVEKKKKHFRSFEKNKPAKNKENNIEKNTAKKEIFFSSLFHSKKTPEKINFIVNPEEKIEKKKKAEKKTQEPPKMNPSIKEKTKKLNLPNLKPLKENQKEIKPETEPVAKESIKELKLPDLKPLKENKFIPKIKEKTKKTPEIIKNEEKPELKKETKKIKDFPELPPLVEKISFEDMFKDYQIERSSPAKNETEDDSEEEHEEGAGELNDLEMSEDKIDEEDQKKLLDFFNVKKKINNNFTKLKPESFYKQIKEEVGPQEDLNTEFKEETEKEYSIEDYDEGSAFEEEEIKHEIKPKKIVSVKKRIPKKRYFEYNEFLNLINDIEDLKKILSNDAQLLSQHLKINKPLHEKEILRVNFDSEDVKKKISKLKSLIPLQTE